MYTPLDRQAMAQTLLQLSKGMLIAAQNQLWDDLDHMQEQRTRVMTALFTDIDHASGEGGWYAIVQEVQATNDALLDLVSRERDKTADELFAIQHARKAELAYGHALEY